MAFSKRGPVVAKEKPSIATVAEVLARRNREAAEIILANPERYPAGSAMAIWAAMVTSKEASSA